MPERLATLELDNGSLLYTSEMCSECCGVVLVPLCIRRRPFPPVVREPRVPAMPELLPTLSLASVACYFSFATLLAWTILLIAHVDTFLAVLVGVEVLPRPSNRDAVFCAVILSGYLAVLLYLM